ncbi:MAG: HAMP domain-containing protein [Neisseriaceae bacterium]|nr:MAG: HAMP domain-containing protein [Neisseriaceae bacterium]
MKLQARSLRVRLLSISLQVLAAGTLLTGILFFINAHHEIDELFDAQLVQMADMLADIEPGSLARHEQDDARQSYHEYERKIGFALFNRDGKLIHHSSTLLLETLPDDCNGFRNMRIDGRSWRMFCHRHPTRGEAIVAWQSHHIRNELAGQIVGAILLPVLIGLPFLALLIWWSSGRVLQPLTQLSRQIAQRTPKDLSPITSRDIPAEIEPIVATLNQLLHRVDEALGNERRFTADAAHELRTPLAALRIQLEVAQAQQGTTSVAALGKALHAVDRAISLVDALLQLARLDDMDTIELQATDVAPIIDAAVAEHGQQALHRRIQLQSNCPSQHTLAVRPELLRILLRNLLDNALKYTPDGGKVCISCNANELAVIDNGPGIEPEQRRLLQQRFARGRDVTVAGHGLGLSIVARICELHKAQLELNWAEPQHGLKVRIVFPRTAIVRPD